MISLDLGRCTVQYGSGLRTGIGRHKASYSIFDHRLGEKPKIEGEDPFLSLDTTQKRSRVGLCQMVDIPHCRVIYMPVIVSHRRRLVL